MSSHVIVTGQIKYPVPLVQKSRASYPGCTSRFPPSLFIKNHQGLNKL